MEDKRIFALYYYLWIDENVKNKGGRSMLSFIISDNFGKKRDNVFASIVF